MNPDYGQWKPIETVPDEGNFLFYIPGECGQKEDGIYQGSRTITGQGKILTIIGSKFDFDRCPATHWMEKPLPPESQETSRVSTDDLRRFGLPVPALNNLENEINSIVRVFAFHEMGEDPIEITDIETLRKYTHDQLVTLPIGFYLAPQTHKPPKDFDEFLEVYGFVENTGEFACGGSIDDKSYGWETFSPDIDEVVKIANSEPGRVHTVVDGDDGRLWLTTGYHLVNRVFYIITQKPYLGADFEIPCEEPRDFERLDLEAFTSIDPDEEIYWAENGGYYDKQAFLDLVKGDIALAYRLYALCEWQCPETLLDEDRNALPEDRVFPELI